MGCPGCALAPGHLCAHTAYDGVQSARGGRVSSHASEVDLMVLSRILRAGEGKMLKRLRTIATHVSALEDDVVNLTDAALRAKTEEFRKRYDGGETLDDLLPE